MWGQFLEKSERGWEMIGGRRSQGRQGRDVGAPAALCYCKGSLKGRPKGCGLGKCL